MWSGCSRDPVRPVGIGLTPAAATPLVALLRPLAQNLSDLNPSFSESVGVRNAPASCAA